MSDHIDHQVHVLACIAEEAGEIVQASCKAIRFGLTEDKLEQLSNEYNDLIGAVSILEGLLCKKFYDEKKVSNKKIKIRSYYNYK